MSRHLAQRLGTGQYLGLATMSLESARQLAGRGLVDHDGEARREFEAVTQHGIQTAPGGQRQYLPAARIMTQHSEGALTDGAGGPQDNELAHQPPGSATDS